MANPPDANTGTRRVTTGAAIGYLVPGAAEERTQFIRAVTAGRNDLETERDISFDDAAVRLGFDQNEAPS